jgi:Pyridoxamine 5'-phosphate oxidase
MVPSELTQFIEGGVAMLGASRDERLRPEAFRVWGAYVADDGRLRVLISSDAGRSIENLGANGQIAVTFTDIHDFRSVQVKGVVDGGIEPAGRADADHLRRYHERFCASLGDVGHPRALGERLRPFAVFCVWVQIEELFDQTPGAVAGTRIEMDR